MRQQLDLSPWGGKDRALLPLPQQGPPLPSPSGRSGDEPAPRVPQGNITDFQARSQASEEIRFPGEMGCSARLQRTLATGLEVFLISKNTLGYCCR